MNASISVQNLIETTKPFFKKTSNQKKVPTYIKKKVTSLTL